ncbi:MAG: acetoin dehydrogenase [Micrococcales bacterium]|nr:MAG: acetoin dehydrogenase [Micrococcales bacterium]PIE28167.1 MAG: acetoin dehydrogenase [Micrococcales bacterium]
MICTDRKQDPARAATRGDPFAGGTAVVTGAASGIGEQLSVQLARRASNLALIDRKAEELAAVAARLRAEHPQLRITHHVVDLADRDQVARVGEDVLAEHDTVTVLLNNAGVGLAGRLDQVSAEETDWLLQINLHAPIALVRAFLPAMHSGARVVLVSSIFGIIAPPGQTAYCTAKFGLRGFGMSLRHELACRGIGVTVVYPGGVRTRIADDARVGAGVSEAEDEIGRTLLDKGLRMDPADAARIILRGVQRGRARVLVGASAVALDLLERAVPTGGGAVLSALYERAVSRHVRAAANQARTAQHQGAAGRP